MSEIDRNALIELLTNGPHKQLVGTKHLTLAFAGLYIVSTTVAAKPLLVWETEKGFYPRYYVPVETLHDSIKAQVGGKSGGQANRHSSNDVKLDVIESLEGKGSGSKADIERLTIGSRSTEWVRFTEGPLKDFIRFERDEIDQWFENGALFAGIKHPYKRIDTTPIASHIVVKIDGTTVAESTVAVLLSETGLKEAYYIPATSVKNWGAVEKSDHKTVCPYKGEAWYYHMQVDGKRIDNAFWYYMYPTHESAGVMGFISFYNKDNVEIVVDGTKV